MAIPDCHLDYVSHLPSFWLLAFPAADPPMPALLTDDPILCLRRPPSTWFWISLFLVPGYPYPGCTGGLQRRLQTGPDLSATLFGPFGCLQPLPSSAACFCMDRVPRLAALLTAREASSLPDNLDDFSFFCSLLLLSFIPGFDEYPLSRTSQDNPQRGLGRRGWFSCCCFFNSELPMLSHSSGKTRTMIS